MADGFLKRLMRGRRRAEPPRETTPFPNFMQVGLTRPGQKLVWKPTPRNLRYFSRSPYARRAINAIKNPIAQLDWEIVPKAGIKETPALRRQIETATYCLANPNNDDSFRTMLEQVMEDVLIGAGAIEVRKGGDAVRPVWLYPVDGLSIQIYPGWAGGRDEARYTQSVGSGTYIGGGQVIQLRDDELIYIRPNPSTSTPFGLGPLEVAFTSISRQLGAAEHAGNVATNARPSVMIDLGEGVSPDVLAAFRSYWQAEIEGQGKTPIIGTKGGAIQKLYPDGDNALFLKWQEFLKTEIAIAFDLAPMNLGVERDVNRSTAEVGEDRDWDHAIVPRATEFASYLTKHAIHRGMGFPLLEFRFLGLKRDDRKLEAEVYEIEYKNGATTPDEYRERTGRAPLRTAYSDLTGVDRDMAKAAAAGSKRVFDPDLPEEQQAPTAPKE